MQMHKLMIAVLAAASLMTACSDETKDKSKEAAASAAKDVKEAGAAAVEGAKEATDKAKETAGAAMDKAKEAGAAAQEKAGEMVEAGKEAAGAAMDSAKEHVHDAATSVANATAPAAEGDKPAESK